MTNTRKHPLTTWREENRVSRRELARRLGCTRQFLWAVECRGSGVGLRLGLRIEAETGIRAESLVKGVAKP